MKANNLKEVKQTNSMQDRDAPSTKMIPETENHGAERIKNHKNFEKTGLKFLLVLALFSVLVVACLSITALFFTRLIELESRGQRLLTECSGYKSQFDAQNENISQLKRSVIGLSAQIAQLQENEVSWRFLFIRHGGLVVLYQKRAAFTTLILLS